MNEQLSVSVDLSRSPVPGGIGRLDARPKVTARDLNFYYGEHHALKSINLVLGENRVTAF
nr:phosphate ABC transporter ATP-binding protein [Afipia sp.]